MYTCIHCGKELKNGMPMYMGKAHIECHKKEHGELSLLSFDELIKEAKRLAYEIEGEVQQLRRKR